MAIGKEIRDRRRLLGLTQPQLAHQLGISPSYITKIEREQLLPTPERLIELAEVLKLDRDRLLIELGRSKQFGVQERIRVRAAKVERVYEGTSPKMLQDAAEDSSGIPGHSTTMGQAILHDAVLDGAEKNLRTALSDPELRETVLKMLEVFAHRARAQVSAAESSRQ